MCVDFDLVSQTRLSLKDRYPEQIRIADFIYDRIGWHSGDRYVYYRESSPQTEGFFPILGTDGCKKVNILAMKALQAEFAPNLKDKYALQSEIEPFVKSMHNIFKRIQTGPLAERTARFRRLRQIQDGDLLSKTWMEPSIRLPSGNS
jgi:hypothetical protein